MTYHFFSVSPMSASGAHAIFHAFGESAIATIEAAVRTGRPALVTRKGSTTVIYPPVKPRGRLSRRKTEGCGEPARVATGFGNGPFLPLRTCHRSESPPHTPTRDALVSRVLALHHSHKRENEDQNRYQPHSSSHRFLRTMRDTILRDEDSAVVNCRKRAISPGADIYEIACTLSATLALLASFHRIRRRVIGRSFQKELRNRSIRTLS